MNRSLKGICFTVAGGCCWGMSGVMGNVCRWSFGDSIYKSMECSRTLGYHDDCNDNWSCILRNDRGIFLLSPWDFHVRTSSGKYAWMRDQTDTQGCLRFLFFVY